MMFGIDKMTPWERRRAIEEGKPYDRVMCMPFMGELKCQLTGVSYYDFWHNPEKMLQTELAAFERFGYDRIVIGPNTRGITDALGGKVIYPENGLPYTDVPLVSDYAILDAMRPTSVEESERLQVFDILARSLMECVGEVVPIEASIGGPFTIASWLRGVEELLRDCKKKPDEVHRLLRIVTDTQKHCIDMAAKHGLGIAMADPVANSALIGPKMYEEFVYPYTKELTEYTLTKTGYKVSLHMCGSTYSIWKYLKTYQLHELSLDNIVDLERAVEELGPFIPIAGNVDPVGIVMNGSEEELKQSILRCIEIGSKAEKGFTLATGCDLPEAIELSRVDLFMEYVTLGDGVSSS